MESVASGFFNNPIVHWYRNIFSHVPSTKVREIAAMLKAVHASEDIVAARQKAVQVIEKMRGLRLTNARSTRARYYLKVRVRARRPNVKGMSDRRIDGNPVVRR